MGNFKCILKFILPASELNPRDGRSNNGYEKHENDIEDSEWVTKTTKTIIICFLISYTLLKCANLKKYITEKKYSTSTDDWIFVIASVSHKADDR